MTAPAMQNLKVDLGRGDPSGNGGQFKELTRLLKEDLSTELDFVHLVVRGVKTSAFVAFKKKLGITPEMLGPATTVKRRLRTSARFTQNESEKLLRVGRVFARAKALFGDDDASVRWLKTPVKWDGDDLKSPLQMAADSEPGARFVEARIVQTMHGIY